MGKKNIRFQPEVEERQQAFEDAEYEAELQAVKAMRSERESVQTSKSPAGPETYNKEGLISAIEHLDTAQLPFVQTYRIDEFSFVLENELDDIERETAFYNHSLAAVKSGYKQLQELGIPVVRPNDFFCEQVKSDAHMTRIKDRLIVEEKRIDAFEKRKNREQNRKFSKQLSEVKKQERSQSEQKLIKDVSQLRKRKSPGDNDTEEKLNKILSSHDKPQKGKKRLAMDKKYGAGGREKKRAKMNDKKSLNDMTTFNPRGGKYVRRDKKKPNRPGKDARQKSRSSRAH